MSERDGNYNFSAGISVKPLTPSLWPVCCAVRDDCHDVLTGWSELQSLRFHNYAADLSSHPSASRHRPRVSTQLTLLLHPWPLLYLIRFPVFSSVFYCFFHTVLFHTISFIFITHSLFHNSLWASLDVHFYNLRWNKFTYLFIYLSIYCSEFSLK